MESSGLDYGSMWGMCLVCNECNEMSVYRGDHTEAIEIDFDPSAVSYSELLHMFWKNHDSTAKTSKQVCRLSQKRLT
jgi:peptide methionine sulfoxide reductase MsrA